MMVRKFGVICRKVQCGEIDLQAQNLDRKDGRSEKSSVTADGHAPRGLDWLIPESVESYEEVGNRKNSAQVNP